MARDRTIYRETYDPIKFDAEHLPVLKHTGEEKGSKFVAVGCELRAAGIIERAGKRMEYQDLRVYVELEK